MQLNVSFIVPYDTIPYLPLRVRLTLPLRTIGRVLEGESQDESWRARDVD